MRFIFILFIQLIRFCSSEEDSLCYFRIFLSNGTQAWCLDEECFNHLDLISIENFQCRTNFLSLRFSSYSTYSTFLRSTSLSSFFSLNRSNLERLLQIEFLSPLENINQPFQLDELKLLSYSIPSNIDTYELIFHGNLIKNPSQLLFDEEIFLSKEQKYIDTLRLIFNCTSNERVEWELVKSIQSIPNSPCPQQIILKQNSDQNQIYIIIVTSCIAFLSIIIIIMIGLVLFYNFYFNNDQIKQRLISDSSISMIERF
ncbi:hypothetical protein I4U23_004754 [Adineta vaga]|nr:hypothetical protein I4U23_004754 [Adineta vaga]